MVAGQRKKKKTSPLDQQFFKNMVSGPQAVSCSTKNRPSVGKIIACAQEHF